MGYYRAQAFLSCPRSLEYLAEKEPRNLGTLFTNHDPETAKSHFSSFKRFSPLCLLFGVEFDSGMSYCQLGRSSVVLHLVATVEV